MNTEDIKLAKAYADLIGVDTVIDTMGEHLMIKITYKNRQSCSFNPFIGDLQLEARNGFDVGIHYGKYNVSVKCGKVVTTILTHGSVDKDEVFQAINRAVIQTIVKNGVKKSGR